MVPTFFRTHARPNIIALLASTGLVVLVGTAPALAGGFAVREQSTEHQGASFAGNAAGGSHGISGMFWNPAIAAYAPSGLYTETHAAAILGNVEMTGDLFLAANGANLGLPRESGNIADPAIVPASYYSWRINERLVAAMSVNSPFGLTTEPSNRFWAGQTMARTSEIKTYNFAPTLAYKLTDTIAVAAGLQIQHMTGRLKNASGPTPTSRNFAISGDDTAFGFTAGINWQPSPHTNIGLGYRSSIDQTLEGTISLVHPTPRTAAIKAGVTLPEIVTLGLRHTVTDNLTLLGTVEWSHWSRLEKLAVTCANNGAPVALTCPHGNGTLVLSRPPLELGWHDGWFFSVGAEYEWSERMKLRTGLAYEISPIQNADERSLRVPDMNRVWASVGATYEWNDKIALDFAYTHIFGVGDDRIDRVEGTLRFVGEVDSQVDIISASLKVKLGPGAEETLK